jgi:hypothetical protein
MSLQFAPSASSPHMRLRTSPQLAPCAQQTIPPANSLTLTRDLHRTAPPSPSLALRRTLQCQQRKQPSHNRPVLEVYTRVTTRISSARTTASIEQSDDTHSPELASYKSVKAPFVLVVPSQAAIVEMNRSLNSGDETAAMYSSQSSKCKEIAVRSNIPMIYGQEPKSQTHS